MSKLTKAQRDQLVQLAAFSRYHIGSRPAVKALVAKGLAWTNAFGCTAITDAGRAALQNKDESR